MEDTDNPDIIATILPKLRRGKHDAFINGHFHFMTHVEIPNDLTGENYVHTPKPKSWWSKLKKLVGLKEENCFLDYEFWPETNSTTGTKESTYNKWELYPQMTMGNAGRELDPLCIDDTSRAPEIWTNNQWYGYGLATVTTEEFKMEYHGIQVPEQKFKPKTTWDKLKNYFGYTVEEQTPVQEGETKDIILYTVTIKNN